MLEYLYTADYSPPLPAPDTILTQTDDEDIPEMDGKPRQESSESSRTFHTERVVTDETGPPIDENSYEPGTENPEDIPGKSEQGPRSIGKKPTTTDGYPLTYVDGQGDERNIKDTVVDASVNHHPWYFHLRMYSEADYFMIDDLKKAAEKNFCESFLEFAETLPFPEIIDELYSTRPNYHALRPLATEMIVNNLLRFRKAPTPIFTPELMESLPNFTYDLFQATLDKYVGGSSGEEKI
jgi:hypothetical protein